MRRFFVLMWILTMVFCINQADATPATIVSMAKNRLAEKLSAMFERTVIECINTKTINQELQQYQDWQLISVNLPNLNTIEAREPVTIIMRNGERMVQLNAWFKVEAYSKGYIAAQSMAVKTPLQAELFTEALIDVAKTHGDLWQQTPEVEMQWTKKAIAKGDVILARDIEKIPEVQHGATVELVSQVASIEVTATGIALMTGEIGQIIHVKNLSTKRTVIGLVIGKNKVKVCEDKS